MTEEPLDVQVARALGWTDFTKDGYYSAHPPYYSTDWSATGPLIVKYGICLQRNSDSTWWAGVLGRPYMVLDTLALPTVCKVILALGKADKL